MDIYGLQKMTLLDYPGKVACTVFLAGCDLRCPFCHNSELLDPRGAEPVMSSEELLSFLKKRRGLLEGVAITGGEPLLSSGLRGLIESIRELGYPVKLDSNGTHPALLCSLIQDGLVDYVAMDIKNSREKYAATCGLESLDLSRINESICLLKEGRVRYEFRTTVMHPLHDSSSFEDIADWLSGAGLYFLQPFTDRDTVAFTGFTAPSEDEMKEWAKIVGAKVKEVQIRGM